MMVHARRIVCAALVLFALSCGLAHAVQPDEILADPAKEARARALSAGLRCLVCQNQSIDDSNAPLARDLRLVVRERITAGDDDRQVIDYVVARYGDFVLLKPPFNFGTLLLWLGPLVILMAASGLVYARWRTAPATAAPAPLSAEEKARLDQLLKSDPG